MDREAPSGGNKPLKSKKCGKIIERMIKKYGTYSRR